MPCPGPTSDTGKMEASSKLYCPVCMSRWRYHGSDLPRDADVIRQLLLSARLVLVEQSKDGRRASSQAIATSAEPLTSKIWDVECAGTSKVCDAVSMICDIETVFMLRIRLTGAQGGMEVQKDAGDVGVASECR